MTQSLYKQANACQKHTYDQTVSLLFQFVAFYKIVGAYSLQNVNSFLISSIIAQ